MRELLGRIVEVKREILKVTSATRDALYDARAYLRYEYFI